MLATVVLCSVRSSERAVSEVCRVLRPLVDRGCDPSRETWSVLAAAPFRELHVERFELALRPVVTGPHIAGHAVR